MVAKVLKNGGDIWSGTVDHILSYKEEITQAMQKLAEDERVIFVGQNVCYPGHVIYETLQGIPDERKIEFPVVEEFQMGFSTGLSLAGFIPVSIYPRFDFLLLAANQLVNHLDKLNEMSQGQFNPKVIIRTMVGNTKPLYPGPQHSQDHTAAFRLLLKHVWVIQICRIEDVKAAYNLAMDTSWNRPVLIVEPSYR